MKPIVISSDRASEEFLRCLAANKPLPNYLKGNMEDNLADAKSRTHSRSRGRSKSRARAKSALRERRGSGSWSQTEVRSPARGRSRGQRSSSSSERQQDRKAKRKRSTKDANHSGSLLKGLKMVLRSRELEDGFSGLKEAFRGVRVSNPQVTKGNPPV